METSEGSSSIGNISAVYNNEIHTNIVDSDVESCANDYEVSYNIPLYDFDHFDDIYIQVIAVSLCTMTTTRNYFQKQKKKKVYTKRILLMEKMRK